MERKVEHALMESLQETLLEFGRGFAFVGRQVHLDVAGEHFVVDLILSHTTQLRHVVVELKAGPLQARIGGTIGVLRRCRR